MRFTREFFDRHGRRVFVPFFVLGYPDDEACLAAVDAALQAGAQALELGLPFSDPIADGPTIQAAGREVLARGFKVADAQRLVRTIRERWPDVPIGLLCYMNALFKPGLVTAIAQWKSAGIDALLAADLPIEEAGEFIEACVAADMGTVFLATPTTTDERLAVIAKTATAYVYVVARLGVTGARTDMDDETEPMIRRLRPLTDQSLVCGFGLSEPAHVQAVVKAGADGAIVGSALVRLMDGAREGGAAAVAAVVGERCAELVAALALA